MKNKKLKLFIDWSLGLKYFAIYNEINDKYPCGDIFSPIINFKEVEY